MQGWRFCIPFPLLSGRSGDHLGRAEDQTTISLMPGGDHSDRRNLLRGGGWMNRNHGVEHTQNEG